MQLLALFCAALSAKIAAAAVAFPLEASKSHNISLTSVLLSANPLLLVHSFITPTPTAQLSFSLGPRNNDAVSIFNSILNKSPPPTRAAPLIGNPTQFGGVSAHAWAPTTSQRPAISPFPTGVICNKAEGWCKTCWNSYNDAGLKKGQYMWTCSQQYKDTY
ncbi:hypothetical protein B0A49_09960 [Cryomyces minteri]|uniref:Uncharacterized protein n=1 Tax=Cryomyces minteri TaxID=331657 RepID=A0A4U0WYU7_9PEZI|nr:hypothetical protein B0A49_09960 [Cryomyces minteri]